MELIQINGSELNGVNIFNETSFHKFIPEGYMISKIVFEKEEFNEDSYYNGESCFNIYIRKIGA